MALKDRDAENKKTSLKDLAQHLGLSQTTVSRGLADYPEVTEATKSRIRAAAAELNYAPSSSAKKLAIGKALTIGHVISLDEYMTLNPYYADFIAGAGAAYAGHGYDMLISMVSADKELHTYRELANSQKVDGFVLSEPKPNDPRLALLQELNIPFIMHGRVEADEDFPKGYSWLDVNNRRGFEEATCYLLERGHRDIALINGLEDFGFAQRRKQGFEKAMQDHGAPIHKAWMFQADMTESRGFEITKQLLDSKDRPSALICSSVLLAMGAQRALTSNGLTLGQDISVICWDDCLSAFHDRTRQPHFTAMQSSIYEAGGKIADMLLSAIANPQQPPSFQLLEAKLVTGQSTGKGPFA